MNTQNMRILMEKLEEAYNYNSWALLPATRVLFGKNRVNIEEIFSEKGPWPNDSAVLVVGKIEIGYQKYRPIFASTFTTDPSPYLSKVGETQAFHHDQTMAKGFLLIENAITITDGEISDPGNGVGVNEKRSIWVFK